jgi:phosphoglycolate phosphatase
MRDTLLFDLDGTIIDTARDLVRATNVVVAQDGRGPGDFTTLRNQVGLGARHLIRTAYGEGLTEAREEELLCDFMADYVSGIADESRPFEGVVDTLATLKRRGHVLAVCTNKPGDLARNLIRQLGLTPLFSKIIGSTDVPRAKPHSDHVFAAAGHREKHRIVLVGDSSVDMLAARNAKVPGILVTYGYSDDAPETLKPSAMMRSFRELPDVLAQL